MSETTFTGTMVTFDPFSQSILAYSVFAHSLGVVVNAILMIAIIRHNHSLSHNNILNLNVILADMILSLVAMSVNAINLGKTSNSVSGIVCQFSGVSVMGSEVVVVFTMLFIAFYQYSCVVLRRPIFKNKSVYFVIVLFWIFGLMTASLPFVLPTSIVDMHSIRQFGGICLPPASTRKPVSIGLEIVTLMVLFLTPILLIFMYIQIWSKIKRARDAVEVAKSTHHKTQVSAVISVHENDATEAPTVLTGSTVPNSPMNRRLSFAVLMPGLPGNQMTQSSNGNALMTVSQLPGRLNSTKKLNVSVEKIILVRAIIVAAIFLVLFFPLACIWTYELISGRSAPYWIEGIGFCLVSTNSYVNPLVLMWMDRPYRRAVSKLFGSPESTKSTSRRKNRTLKSTVVSHRRSSQSESNGQQSHEENGPSSSGRSLPRQTLSHFPSIGLHSIIEERESSKESPDRTTSDGNDDHSDSFA